MLRIDQKIIVSLVDDNDKIIDIGCDNGELLNHICAEKNVTTRGIEISMAGVNECVRNGHSVVHGDANTDLIHYPTKSFDKVILSKTLQAMNEPHETLKQITRMGKKAIVGFSNFGHYKVISDLVFNSRMPVTKSLPISWYETPNIHFCTIKDFINLCEELGLKIEKTIILKPNGSEIKSNPKGYYANLFGSDAIFVISDK
ncbi:MAG: methionine biosynthesis protein MetW [Alphaproteobacteria bacterium]